MARPSARNEVAIACTMEAMAFLDDARILTDAIRAEYVPVAFRTADLLGAIDAADAAVRKGDSERAYALLYRARQAGEFVYDGLASTDIRYGEAVVEIARLSGRKRQLSDLMRSGVPFADAEEMVA